MEGLLWLEAQLVFPNQTKLKEDSHSFMILLRGVHENGVVWQRLWIQTNARQVSNTISHLAVLNQTRTRSSLEP